MKNVSQRLTRLEQNARPPVDTIEWHWEIEPAYLAMNEADQAATRVIMEKMLPFLPHDVKGALATLTDEELDRLEAFYSTSALALEERKHDEAIF